MLNLLITSTEQDFDVEKNHNEIIKTVRAYDKDFKVLFFVRENDKHFKTLARITTNTPNHFMMVCDYKTSDDEIVYMGLDILKGTDTLLLPIDTKPETIVSVIEKQRKGFDIVRVRQTEKSGKNFFAKLGILAYNFGLKLYGKKNSDYFAEPEIEFFDGRIVHSLSKSVGNNKEVRITNCFNQAKNGLIEEKELFVSRQAKKVVDMFSYGMIAFFYLIALLALLTIYPIFNNMFYSWWMIVAILIWVGFGFLMAIVVSKKIYVRRCGYGNRVDVNDEPMFDALYVIDFGDALGFEEEETPTISTAKQKFEALKNMKKPVLKKSADKTTPKKVKKNKEVK